MVTKPTLLRSVLACIAAIGLSGVFGVGVANAADPSEDQVLATALPIVEGDGAKATVESDGAVKLTLAGSEQSVAILAPAAATDEGKAPIGDGRRFRMRGKNKSMVNQAGRAAIRSIGVLSNKKAENSLTYALSLPPSTELAATADGGFDIQTTGSVSTPLFHIDAPWAKDALGRSLRTSYKLDGSNLIQLVETRGAAFPVIADPTVYPVCGYASCSIFFSRTTTKDIAAGTPWTIFAGAAIAACGKIPNPFGAAACAGVAAVYSVTGYLTAQQATRNNACLKLVVPYFGGPSNPPYWDISNTSNCRS